MDKKYTIDEAAHLLASRWHAIVESQGWCRAIGVGDGKIIVMCDTEATAKETRANITEFGEWPIEYAYISKGNPMAKSSRISLSSK